MTKYILAMQAQCEETCRVWQDVVVLENSPRGCMIDSSMVEQFLAQNGEMVVRMATAVLLGTLIGAERTLVHKEAGMKTHALVALGAALFVAISESLSGRYGGLAEFDPGRVLSQVVVGIGFLGAGLIIFQNNKLLGITTAGGLWVTAAIGAAAGFGFFGLALVATVLTIFIFVVMNIVEKPIRKISEGNQD